MATEGRTLPSLHQLDEAVRAFIDEYPDVDVLVVADASFEHRIDASERARFKEAELAGEIVTPPAGAVGRGDAFILKIAARVNAQVLSNDSYQEFQDEHPWLFDVGRLIGGKPVPAVGWIFTERLPVRASKTTRNSSSPTKSAPAAKKASAAKKLTVAMPDGSTPTIGATLTPVAKKAPVAKKVAEKAPVATPAPKTAAKKVVEKAPAATSSPKAPAKKAATKKAPAKKAAPVEKKPPAAQRRDRQPVNPEELFGVFISEHRVRSHLDGVVKAFTSHGAVIQVAVSGGVIECYAPTTQLGKPAPARARDVLKRGDKRSFKLTAVDKERRIAELALV
jgi:hypothetical protein